MLRIPLLGVLAGALAGGSVLAFRWSVETSQSWFLPGGRLGNYESLPLGMRFLLPVVGALALGWAFNRLPGHLRGVGIVHLITRLRTPGALKLPLGNALVQFFGGGWAIVSGQSVDREGPGVHLGAASANMLPAQAMPVDDRTLAACGAAASIAAAFNTPLAGIVFVIEVLEIRYDVARFLPIMVSAVTGAVFGRLAYGQEPAFHVPVSNPVSLGDLGWVLLLGVAAGLLAAAFIALIERVNDVSADWSPLRALGLAGLITGVLALPAPQIMGISYDTLERILDGGLSMTLLLTVLACKFGATALAIGLRMPGGLIGPSLVIGGALGAIVAVLVEADGTAHYTFYPLVGMVAMMGATLQAPLAALTALLELTGRTELILPGTVTVIGADLLSRLILGKDSVFVALARRQRGSGED